MNNIDRECKCEKCLNFSDDETEDCIPIKRLRKELEEQVIARNLAICAGLDAGLEAKLYEDD